MTRSQQRTLRLKTPQDKKNKAESSDIQSKQIQLMQKLQSALEEAMSENDLLRERAAELEAMLAESQEENQHKDKAIKELYDLIQEKERDMEGLRETIQQQKGDLAQLRLDVDSLLSRQL